MSQERITKSSQETKELGRELAKKSLKEKQAFVIGLVGDLGSGKTTFLQGFAKGLGIKEKILSPTFVILKKFQISGRFKNFYHIDCYRLKKSKELLDLEFEEIVSSSQNIVAVEWADQVKKTMPKNTIWIKFDFIDEKKRKITIGKVLC